MNFYTKRRRPPTVPIVTLIDILAILLIFFIATTTFKKRESLVKVNLPQSSELSATGERDVRVPLAISPTGEVSLGEKFVRLDGLSAALAEFKAENPGVKLELKADEKTPLGLVVKVWDAATKAGVEIDEIPLRILLEQ
ncbi:MAG: biopolymer transporter ExbD [Verrucomicrobiales bacterium]|nr:biopolymer transporter ExbD [Verrucomicrobiales bacterium]